MRTLLYSISFVFIASHIMVSCDDSTCLQTRGKATKSHFSTDSFSTIRIHGIFDVHITPDSINFIEFSGGSNLINQSEWTVQDGTLSLFNYSQCVFFKQFEHIQVTIHTSNLDSLFVYSPCKISTDTIHRNLYISTQTDMIDAEFCLANTQTYIATYYKAGGLINLKGTSNRLKIIANYVLQLNLEDFQGSHITINNNTNQDIYIQQCDTLVAKTSKTGYIYYSEKPVIITSSDKVRPTRK